jgi:hypothetical protein
MGNFLVVIILAHRLIGTMKNYTLKRLEMDGAANYLKEALTAALSPL